MILSNWEPHTVERSIPILVDAIKQGLNDADPDARAASRKAYHALADNFKEHAEMLFQSLDGAKQRTLAGEMSQSSSSQSIGGVRRSQENLAARGGSSGYGMQRGGPFISSVHHRLSPPSFQLTTAADPPATLTPAPLDAPCNDTLLPVHESSPRFNQ
jgi:hypothetical protein